MTVSPPATDEHLALMASRGDRDAFAGLYERYFRGVYDLSVRMVRDPDAALDVVQNTFLSAWENLQKRTVTGNVKAWIYTIARNAAINELRRNKRLRTTTFGESEHRTSLPFDRVDTNRMVDPQRLIQDHYYVDLVWSSASALNPQDYSLLDLHLRKDLGVEELASTLGVSRGTMHTRLSRLRDALGQSVSASLLIRRGRQDCPALSAILSEGQFAVRDRDDRLAVKQHLAECARCQENQRRYLAPAEIFAGLALVPVPEGAREVIWVQLGAAIAGGAAGISLIGAIGEKVTSWLGGTPVKGAVIAGGGGIVTVGLVVITFLVVTSGGSEDADPPGAPVAVRAAATTPTASPPPTPVKELPRSAPTPPSSDVAQDAATPAPDATATPAPKATPTPTPQSVVTAGPTPAPTPEAIPDPTPATVIQVSADVRAAINLTSRLVLQTTIYGSSVLPASALDFASLTMDGAAPQKIDLQDTDHDGNQDLVLQFRVPTPAPGAELCMRGLTVTGQPIAGCAPVKIVPGH